MKKRIFALLLSALLLANATACNTAPENDTEISFEDINTIESTLNLNNQDGESRLPDSLEKTSTMTVDFNTYNSIILTYRKIVELCPQYEMINEGDHFTFSNNDARGLYEKIFTSTLLLYPRNHNGIKGNCYEQFGYVIEDLNNDGIDELILKLDDHRVISLFTMVNRKPVLLDNYWNRKNCWIDPDGYLHVGGSNGADRSVSQIYRISDQTGELILLEEWGTDGYDEISGITLYYKLFSNTKIYITQEEYRDWVQSLPYAKFDVTETISEYLPFISLFNQDYPAPEPYIPRAEG